MTHSIVHRNVNYSLIKYMQSFPTCELHFQVLGLFSMLAFLWVTMALMKFLIIQLRVYWLKYIAGQSYSQNLWFKWLLDNCI